MLDREVIEEEQVKTLPPRPAPRWPSSIVSDHACPTEPMGGKPGGFLIRCSAIALFFSRKPTEKMRENGGKP